MLGLMAAIGLASLGVVPDEASATPPAPGTVFVTLAAQNGRDPVADQPFADAVGQALGSADFTIMPEPGHSRYIAEVSINREQKGIAAERVKAGRVQAAGAALAVPFGAKTQLRALVLTTLTVRIVGRDDHRQVWRASAVTVQPEGTPAGAPEAVAAKLARVVVAAYPVTPAAPVSVP